MNVKGSDLRLPAARGLDPAGPNSVFFNGIGRERRFVNYHRALNRAEIRSKAQNIISELDVPTRHIPFTIAAAEASLNKVMWKMPPSDRSQQFKDGVIWADCITLAQEADVYLIGDDKAFFAGHDYKGGLAGNLLTEAKNCPHRVTLFRSLVDLLPEIKSPIEVDDASIAGKIVSNQVFTTNSVEMPGFALEKPPIIRKKMHHTEAAHSIFVEFEADFRCTDTTMQGRQDGRLTCEGECFYDQVKREAINLFLKRVTFNYLSEAGEVVSQGVAVAGSVINVGPQVAHYGVRRAIG
jgi:hypothetical protein